MLLLNVAAAAAPVTLGSSVNIAVLESEFVAYQTFDIAWPAQPVSTLCYEF